MEIITSNFSVYCDTFSTEVTAKMHEAKEKRKLQLTITGKDESKQDVSLWKEDVLLLADFLKGMAENLDKRTDG